MTDIMTVYVLVCQVAEILRAGINTRRRGTGADRRLFLKITFGFIQFSGGQAIQISKTI